MSDYKVERTKNVPLRLIGNAFEKFAHDHLIKAAFLYEDNNFGLRYKYHVIMWEYLSKPYEKWGTYYKFNSDFLNDLGGSGWDDYDENGHPYWYFTEWQEDPVTGDAWKLIKRS